MTRRTARRMIGAGHRRGRRGPTEAPRGPIARATGMSLTLIAATTLLILQGCSSVQGSAGPGPGEAAAYQSELSTSRAAQSAKAGAELCGESTKAMVVMLRGYNAFIAGLNAKQSYDKIGDLGDRARAALIAGTDMVRPKQTAEVPDDLAGVVASFVASSGALGDVIGRRQTAGLNAASTTWTDDRRSVLDVCRTYLPAPPATSAVQTPTSSSPSDPNRQTPSAPSPTPTR